MASPCGTGTGMAATTRRPTACCSLHSPGRSDRPSPGCWRRSRPPRRSSRSRAGTSAQARAGARSGSASPPPPCSSRGGCRTRSAWLSRLGRCWHSNAGGPCGRWAWQSSRRLAVPWRARSWRWPRWPSRSPASGTVGAARCSWPPPASRPRSCSPPRSPREAASPTRSPPSYRYR